MWPSLAFCGMIGAVVLTMPVLVTAHDLLDGLTL
jgi:hypothetical protein